MPILHLRIDVKTTPIFLALFTTSSLAPPIFAQEVIRETGPAHGTVVAPAASGEMSGLRATPDAKNKRPGFGSPAFVGDLLGAAV